MSQPYRRSARCPSPSSSPFSPWAFFLCAKQNMASASWCCCEESEWAVPEGRRDEGGDPVEEGADLTHEQASV